MSASTVSPDSRPLRRGLDERSPLTWIAFVAFTAFFAFGSTLPFFTAWRVREKPEFQAAHTWILESEATEEVVGINRRIESDWFPKGGSDGKEARFEFKLTGANREKQAIGVIVTRTGEDTWTVTRASWLDGKELKELEVR